MSADEFLGAVPEKSLDAVVDEAEAALGVEHVDDVRAVVDNETMALLRVLQLAVHLLNVLLELALVQHVFDSPEQFVRDIRLAQEIVSAAAHGQGGAVEGGLAADDDHGAVGVVLPDGVEDLVSIDPRHVQIKKEQVDLLLSEQFKGLLASVGAEAVIAVGGKQMLDALTHSGIVIHDHEGGRIPPGAADFRARGDDSGGIVGSVP